MSIDDPYVRLVWRIRRYLELQKVRHELLTAHRYIQEMKETLGISDDEPSMDIDTDDPG